MTFINSGEGLPVAEATFPGSPKLLFQIRTPSFLFTQVLTQFPPISELLVIIPKSQSKKTLFKLIPSETLSDFESDNVYINIPTEDKPTLSKSTYKST